MTAPVLVVGGPAVTSTKRQLAWLAEQTPGGRYVPVDATHLVHTDNPDGFLTALHAFGTG
ncbi:hypothetical protein GTW52_14360 [Streptomyces sp. SID8358]|uniref:alpha/beta fold hydrolase n=1 Tax=Streptomyces sp. SID8358 TaxID=2690342 RepID=UPI000DB4E464|nr:hypothetical protein [Streptomyces sp. SID8358]MYU34285.1 hypothetical protein [Streptomyces sp. SID8358]